MRRSTWAPNRSRGTTAGDLRRDHIANTNAQQFVSQQCCATRGQVGLARKKQQTRWRCGQRRCVLPNVALRSLQVLGMLVKNGGRMLADDELQDTPTAVHQPAARAQPATASRSGWGSTSTEFSRRGGFSQRLRVDPVEIWQATQRAAHRRAAHCAGVNVVGALATLWGRGVQARLRGSRRRTGSWKGLQDMQPADRQHT